MLDKLFLSLVLTALFGTMTNGGPLRSHLQAQRSSPFVQSLTIRPLPAHTAQ